MPDTPERLATLEANLAAVQREFAQYRADSLAVVRQLEERIGKCITVDRFRTVEAIAVGLASLVLVSTIGAILSTLWGKI